MLPNNIQFFEKILYETGLMVLLSTGSFLWPLYFAYIKLNKVSHNGAHLTLDIMLLPLLTRNVCIYLLNVSFFYSLFTIPIYKTNTLWKFTRKPVISKKLGFVWWETEKTNKIYIMDQDVKNLYLTSLISFHMDPISKEKFDCEQFRIFLLCFVSVCVQINEVNSIVIFFYFLKNITSNVCISH